MRDEERSGRRRRRRRGGGFGLFTLPGLLGHHKKHQRQAKAPGAKKPKKAKRLRLRIPHQPHPHHHLRHRHARHLHHLRHVRHQRRTAKHQRQVHGVPVRAYRLTLTNFGGNVLSPLRGPAYRTGSSGGTKARLGAGQRSMRHQYATRRGFVPPPSLRANRISSRRTRL